ncbi:hypothetical protein WDW86_15770 [Bdellovibrionota bacterium FG-2]
MKTSRAARLKNKTKAAIKSGPKTIEDIFQEISEKRDFIAFFKWPPDAFAFTSMILAESGAYRQVVEHWPPERLNTKWVDGVEQLSEDWREWAETKKVHIPSELKKKIEYLSLNISVSIASLAERKYSALCSTILELHAIADTACRGVGIPGFFPTKHWTFYAIATALLKNSGTISTIHRSRVKVIPKIRTPQVGISLRSLSHHVAVDRSEVEVKWIWQPISNMNAEEERLNLIVLPWPTEIDPSSFGVKRGSLKNMDPKKFRFFDYDPEKKFDFHKANDLIVRAQKKVGEIHGVILPECAIHEKELVQFRRMLKANKIPFFVVGARDARRNYAQLGLLSPLRKRYDTYNQDKHHRWQINRSQILTYDLGCALHPAQDYWEDIKVLPRSVNFVGATDWLTMCHLICEDLARHDPVAHLIRSVGPNLVIALLLDGPQLSERWPGRYASVLADDPGSSVLTVTSLGMALRSRPPGKPVSRVIALWKDSKGGSRQIALEGTDQAAILTLCAHRRKEWTADGREEGKAFDLLLAGVEYV